MMSSSTHEPDTDNAVVGIITQMLSEKPNQGVSDILFSEATIRKMGVRMVIPQVLSSYERRNK